MDILGKINNVLLNETKINEGIFDGKRIRQIAFWIDKIGKSLEQNSSISKGKETLQDYLVRIEKESGKETAQEVENILSKYLN